MNKSYRWFSVSLLVVTLCLSGCLEMTAVDLNSMPSVISASKEMSKEDAVAKLQSMEGKFLNKQNNNVTVTASGFEVQQKVTTGTTTNFAIVTIPGSAYASPLPSSEEQKTMEAHSFIAFEDIVYVQQMNHFGAWLYLYGEEGGDPSEHPRLPECFIYVGSSSQLKEFLSALYVLCPKLKK